MDNPVVQPIDVVKKFVDLFESAAMRGTPLPLACALELAGIMREANEMLEMKRRRETVDPLFDPALDLPRQMRR
jgi:hypothetical protein